jgi:hypothetical protein
VTHYTPSARITLPYEEFKDLEDAALQAEEDRKYKDAFQDFLLSMFIQSSEFDKFLNAYKTDPKSKFEIDFNHRNKAEFKVRQKK